MTLKISVSLVVWAISCVVGFICGILPFVPPIVFPMIADTFWDTAATRKKSYTNPHLWFLAVISLGLTMGSWSSISLLFGSISTTAPWFISILGLVLFWLMVIYRHTKQSQNEIKF
jgi:cytochrome c biogenesis protein CcdA